MENDAETIHTDTEVIKNGAETIEIGVKSTITSAEVFFKN